MGPSLPGTPGRARHDQPHPVSIPHHDQFHGSGAGVARPNDDRDAGLLERVPDRAWHRRRVVCRAGDYGRRAQIDRRRSWRRALGAGAGLFARLARRVRRRHRDGPRRRAVWRARDSDFRLADDRAGAGAGAERQCPRPARRLRGVYRPPRQCRDECAALHLCLALVRSPARHGSGPARQRLVGLGGDLGADLRGGGGADRLAQHDARASPRSRSR